MGQAAKVSPAFVIKAEEIAVLNHFPADHPPPLSFEWINRGTDQALRRSTIDMLLRTLSETAHSPSVSRLHKTAGLRLVFRTDEERDRFVEAFDTARAEDRLRKNNAITAIFDHREDAERVVSDLIGAGIPKEAISVLWRTGRHVDVDGSERQGHGRLSVAASVAGGGVAGALLGIAVIAIPGLGAVAAAGAVAASTLSSVAAVSAAIGATGGAIARMLSDLDVEGSDRSYLARQIQRGKVFVAVDLRVAVGRKDDILGIMSENENGVSRVGLSIRSVLRAP